ncbi:zinc finger CCCH domain-containing protein 13-like [Papaver somniferum]|uniref:zinc finger CCCH domain-containing protein 13-like n=1 Tax=Papaver somniferum TaxID=3469 RepID=UPI000E6F9F99|nr:zinc finger CCCH domain-containing protein 13-like [Papaver somniferum]
MAFEGVLTDGASEMLKKLITAVGSEISLVWGVKDELKMPKQTLEVIAGVTSDAERKQLNDAAVSLWLKRLKDVSYDADDVLDEISYEAMRRSIKNSVGVKYRTQNLRLQEQRSRIATRSRSRSSRSSSRQSQSNQGNDRRRKHMEVIEENSQKNENLEEQRERRRIVDLATNQYAHPRELLRRAHTNLQREEEDPRKGSMILHDREILRDEYERERETARARDRQRREELEEKELQNRLRHIDFDNRVRKRERHRIDDTEQGRVTPQEIEISRHRYDRTGKRRNT